MKLHADPRPPHLTVTACGNDHVVIADRMLRRSLLLMPGHLDEHWGPTEFRALVAEHLAELARVQADVLLLGTGLAQRFPPPALLRPIYETGRSVEVMDTPAACRTYNLLVAEGRLVAAALIIETENAS